MLGFADLTGSEPCPQCGSDSGDCSWLFDTGRCSAACACCGGTNVGRCGYCDEVVPCGLESARNPRRDARCTWDLLARLHAEDCRWVESRGGHLAPMPASIAPVFAGTRGR